MTRKVFFTVLLALVLLLGVAAPVAAQSNVSGSVQGTVKDTQGAPLPGVAVTAFSDVLVARKTTAYTDDHGVYRFPSLPPGSYAIEAELSGFVKVRQEDVRVSAGQALRIDITLPQAKMAEAVTVTAEAPVVSVVSNTVATTFDTGFIDRQPLPRNYYSLLAAAPGVTLDITSSAGSSMMAYGGTSQSQNAYTLDGVNVADPANAEYWLLPSIQWMQEIQIGGMGANAEYGGFTGGIINGVTKSGGNEFHGGVEAYYQPSSWVADNDPTGPMAPTKFHDYAISLGGAIKQDKLWYFLSGEDWEQDTSPLGAARSTNRKVPRYLGKLTWQEGTNNRLMFMIEHDGLVQDYRGVSGTTLPDATYREESPNYTFAASWESLLNANNFVNVKLTGFDGRLDDLPYHGTNTPGRQDQNTGIYWQNLTNTDLSHRHLVTFDGSWSLFKDGLFAAKDSHTFKFGATYENSSVSYNSTPNGGATYYDDSSNCPGANSDEQFAYMLAHPECGLVDGDSYRETGYGEYHEWLQTSTINLYAQDSMRLDRFTLNYGARYGSLKGGFQQGHGNTDVYNVSFVDPRIGFVWDVSGDARTAVKAHWGRYHQKMLGYIYDREVSGHIAPPTIDCYWDSATGKYDLDSNGDPGCETYSVPPAATMGNYGHQYVDESLITLEQQLGRDMVVGVDLVDRKFRDIMAMINVNEDYTEKIVNNKLTGGTLPIWILNSAQQYVLTTDNGAYRDYQSVMLRLEKRYAHGWQLSSSLVWTDLKGNQYSNDGYISNFQDRNGLTNADGRIDLSYNKWEFKLNGAVDLPLNLQASGQFSYFSGMYWQPFVRVTSGLNYNSSTGRDIYLEPRGTEQFPSRHLVNLRLAWNPKLAGALRLTVSGEVFNLLNNNTMLDTYNRYANYNARKDTWSLRGNYGDPYTIESPRQVRLGVRLEF